MKKIFTIASFLISFCSVAQTNWSERMAATVMNTWRDSFSLDGKPAKWTYDQGVILKGIEGLWYNTGDAKYYEYIQKCLDYFVKDNGTIKAYNQDEYTLDNINNGKLLLLLYRVTLKEKYLKACQLLREQLRSQPRTTEGGFWHKKIYPYQMWLDGLYMAAPFYAEYAWLIHEDTAFNDIANQFIWMEKHTRDAKTGLLYHGWDESKQQQWASKQTGTSPNFWARAMGWYAMAIVDALDYFPNDHPKRKDLVAILTRLANAIEKVQDSKTGLWWDLLNLPDKKGNYLEASASSMFVYAIAKGVRKGYLPALKISIARKGYEGIIKQSIKTENGQTNLYGTVKVSGLGGNPYRDGSYEYYIGEPVVMNDPKGVGAFLLAGNEMEMRATVAIGKGKTVLLDNYFNHELRKEPTGDNTSFHYIWNEMDNNGYSIFGHVFNKYGVRTKTLTTAPTSQNLRDANIYIIVDPDTDKETAKPNYIELNHVHAIFEWVKNGGVLVMMANDSGNVEFKHFNQLAERFGIHFNENLRHDVINNQFEQGALPISNDHPIFKTAKKVFIKQLCTMEARGPAYSVYTENGEVLMAVSRIGKGAVFAVGDPWLYNEYTDGRKLPMEYENYKAAEDLAKWLIKPNLTGTAAISFLPKKITVDLSGKGNFKSIQEAINSLPDSSATPTTVFIKGGTYHEKIFITKYNIILEGEDRDKTIITQDIARDEWRCSHPDDWGVATMNINGNDITLKNLTIANDYGFNVKEIKIVDCPNDSLTHKKTITNDGHQMALRTMKATRLKAINCHFRAYAGDTVSPWNTLDGMFYFKDCIMEGGVDFYCPRGWAWAENCKFYANTGPASIWHDGSGDPDEKSVLKKCSFDGYKGFMLGRHHREAQFYLVDCRFSKNMKDTFIYHVPTTEIKWGERIYYYDCHRRGGNDFLWYKNNLPEGINANGITVNWLFKNKWNPTVDNK